MARQPTFYDLLTEAMDYFATRGYTSSGDIERWVKVLKGAAERTLQKQIITEDQIRRGLRSTYKRMIVGGSILKKHTGVGKFTLQKLAPSMRADLERRIFASANLIKLNRDTAIAETLRRFEGWATSVPRGGSRAIERVEQNKAIRKSLTDISFRERRVIVDQSHKFAASLSATIASANEAIAYQWHSNWRRPGYQYREDHKERDDLVYAIRGNWAIADGYMKAGPNGYSDEITQPSQEIFCSCSATYIYTLASLPDDMLTAKGRTLLASPKH